MRVLRRQSTGETLTVMATPEQITQLTTLLSGTTPTQIKTAGIAALKEWHQTFPNRRQFSIHGDFGRPFTRQLAAARGIVISEGVHEAMCPTSTTLYQDECEVLSEVNEFVAWLVQAGLAVPLGALFSLQPITYYLTNAGKRFLDASEDHALLPTSLERLRTRCPNLPEDVVVMLIDAHACVEKNLLRPAIVMMGVAYELAIEKVLERLVAAQSAPQDVSAHRAARRIEDLRTAVRTIYANANDRDRRATSLRACDFADSLRNRRNDGSHTTPRYPFDDREEMEQMLMWCGLQLPVLWSIGLP